MPMTVGDTGSESFLRIRFNNVWPTNKDLTLKLFTNNKTPADNDTAASYTEATGGGYASKTLTCGSWTVTNGAALAQATYSQQVFTFTGPLTTNPSIYGYFVVDADGVFQWAEKFDVFVTPLANGNHIDVTPVFTASKGTPT